MASSPPGVDGKGARVDVFNAAGEYLTEIKAEHGACDLAVDSEGNLYVMQWSGESGEVLLFTPSSYPPHVGTTYPAEAKAVVVYPTQSDCGGKAHSIAVDPSNDHLYINAACVGVSDFGSAAENLPASDWSPLGEPIVTRAAGISVEGFDVYGKDHDIYATGFSNVGTSPPMVAVFDGSTGEKKCESDGSETPAGHFNFPLSSSLAIDQSSGDFYVDDTKLSKAIDHFDSACHFLDQLPANPPNLEHVDRHTGLAVDDPCVGVAGASCDLGGYHSPNNATVYVGSGEVEGKSHLYAFPLRVPGPPEIEAQLAISVTDTEARLSARLNPHSASTTYRFEYISRADYEADGEAFGVGSLSIPVPDGNAGESASFASVSEPIAGLQPATAYRFRLVATNCGAPHSIEGDCLTSGEGNPGGNGGDATFSTYLPAAEGLPDGRGYELVTPPDTGGYLPTMNELGFSSLSARAAFATDFAGPGGDSLLFGIEGGSLPGLPGGGFHDTYEAHREADGPYGLWSSAFNGIDGAEARQPTADGFASDHDASFWTIVKGTLAEEGNYIRRSGGVLDPKCSPEPAGKLELIGCGSLGTEPRASGGWISADAGHVIFATAAANDADKQQLEPQAPPTGTSAVYDRTSDGVTHVVSLKPGNVPFAAGENADYQGTSTDGTAVAFTVKGTLYVRLDNQATVEVAEGSPTFGGLSQHGDRIVYLRPNSTEPFLSGTEIPQGEVFVCEVRSGPCTGPGAQAPIQIGSGEKSVLVNVSADGSHVYFAEEDRLYVWDGSSIHLIAELDPSDLIGEEGVKSNVRVGGLGLWVTYVVTPYPGPNEGPASDPSRTTPDGSVLVFESRAELTGYDSGEHSEIYRYDSTTGNLACLSCNPTGVAATSDAQLESDPPHQFVSLPPVNAIASIANVSANGRRVFFQSAERLVLGDTDGKLDVYEWETQGEGGCIRASGCIRLISSGHSAADDYLYAMTPDGHDVFFESGDRLTNRDSDATPSIYDARIGGGEAPVLPPSAECLGEACQPAVAVPGEPSSSVGGSGNTSSKPASRCPKGRHRVKGKSRCLKPHKHKARHQKRANSSRRVSR